jgi:hypothetical protein
MTARTRARAKVRAYASVSGTRATETARTRVTETARTRVTETARATETETPRLRA